MPLKNNILACLLFCQRCDSSQVDTLGVLPTGHQPPLGVQKIPSTLFDKHIHQALPSQRLGLCSEIRLHSAEIKSINAISNKKFNFSTMSDKMSVKV